MFCETDLERTRIGCRGDNGGFKPICEEQYYSLLLHLILTKSNFNDLIDLTGNRGLKKHIVMYVL